MVRFLASLAYIHILFCCVSSKAASGCQKHIAESYLEVAVDMIAKAKTNFPTAHCESNLTRRASDCSELLEMGYNKSGVYTIWPESRVTEGRPVEVYCDMETDGGGWTLIQRRGDFGRPTDYFFKDWKSYKVGFGDIEKDFWLGNDNIFALTNQKLHSVRFDLRDVDNNTRYAQYETFWIDDEYYKYTLHISGYTGDAGDSMINLHNYQKFSTKDQDNDSHGTTHCAQTSKGAWWYKNCLHSNLNGLHYKGKHTTSSEGVNWGTWKGYQESLKSTEIKIRPPNFRLPHATLNTPM